MQVTISTETLIELAALGVIGGVAVRSPPPLGKSILQKHE